MSTMAWAEAGAAEAITSGAAMSAAASADTMERRAGGVATRAACPQVSSEAWIDRG